MYGKNQEVLYPWFFLFIVIYAARNQTIK